MAHSPRKTHGNTDKSCQHYKTKASSGELQTRRKMQRKRRLDKTAAQQRQSGNFWVVFRQSQMQKIVVFA